MVIITQFIFSEKKKKKLKLKPNKIKIIIHSCHPQVGGHNQRVFGEEHKSMDEVLVTMRDQSASELTRTERALINCKFQMSLLISPKDILKAENILQEIKEQATIKFEEIETEIKANQESENQQSVVFFFFFFCSIF